MKSFSEKLVYLFNWFCPTSLQKEEVGFEHQAAIMPDVPPPEQLLNLEEIRERRLTDPRIPAQYRNSVAKNKFRPWPIEMRVCEDSVSQHKLIQMRCGGSASQHKPRIWFHKPVKADDWLLYVIESPSTHGGRGFVTGRMFNRQGELIVSLTQEALIRREKTRGPNPRPKLWKVYKSL